MSLFPADAAMTIKKIVGLVDALVAGRFYEPYEADGKQFLHIRNFAKYQRLDHPAAPKCPLAPGQEYVYHVRQGNTFIPKIEKALPSSIPRTAHEQHTNVSVPFSQERSGLEGSGLDGKGQDGKGQGKEGTGEGNPIPDKGDGEKAQSSGKGKDSDDGHAIKDPALLAITNRMLARAAVS
jgi:hypothetical protein